MSKFFKSTLGIGITAFVIVLIAGTMIKNSGIHFQDFKFVRGGDIAIEAAGISASIFIDQKKVVSEDDEASLITLLNNITPGPHSILVFNEERWPWRKDIVVRSGETTSIKPFLLKKNPSGIIVTDKDPEYPSLLQDISSASVPTKNNPRVSKSGLVNVWIEDGVIKASWAGEESTLPGYFCNDEKECNKEIVALDTAENIRNVDFLGDKDDLLLVAFSNGVFALEIDKRGGTQNFQPIYKGTELPIFKKYEDSVVHVVDGQAVFIINL